MLKLVASLLVFGALAAPLVVDADRPLPAGQAKALQTGLASLGRHMVVVVSVKSRPGSTVEAVAERTFAARRLDRDDVCVAFDVAGRKVAAHVGQDLTNHGLDRAAIQAVIDRTFRAPARAGKYDVATLALAQGLINYRVLGVRVSALPDGVQVGAGFMLLGLIWFFRRRRTSVRHSRVAQGNGTAHRRSGWLTLDVDSASSSHDDDLNRWSGAASTDWSSSDSSWTSSDSSSSSSDSGGSTGSSDW